MRIVVEKQGDDLKHQNQSHEEECPSIREIPYGQAESEVIPDETGKKEAKHITSYNGCDRYQQHVPDLFIPIQSLPPPRACRARLSLVSPRIPRRRPPLLYRPTL